MEDLGRYRIIVEADYSNMISAMNAAMDAVVKKTESISKAIEAATQNVDKSMKAMSSAMKGSDVGGSGVDSMMSQYDALREKMTRTAKDSGNAFKVMQEQVSASIERTNRAAGAGSARSPLAGENYNQHVNGFNNIDAAIGKTNKSIGLFNTEIKKMRSHIEWMVSGALAGGVLLAPFAAVGSIAKIEQEMAGLKQVLPDVQNDQAKLNKTTMEFIGIAAQYGLKIDEITESAKLWGRAYKDVNTIETLLHSSSILAVADSFAMTEANKALESTMMQFGMRARSAAEAQQFSMKIVDSWTNVAHNAIVSAQDLAAANERSASAAKQAGVSFDFLQGMIGTMARNTGRAGAEVGNAIRSLMVSIHTDKAIKEIEKMGVSMYNVGKDGTKSFRDVESVMLDLMVVSDSTDKNVEKLMQSISGGKFQYNKVASLVGDYNELIRVTELSINSQGVAQHQAEMQIDTLSRKFQTLRDQLQAIAVGAGNSGLTQWLKDVVDGVNSILSRVATMPSGNWQIIGMVVALSAGIGALNIILKAGTTGWIEYKTLIDAATVAKGKQVAANIAEAASQRAVNAAGANGALVSGLSTAAKQAETATTIQLTYAERALAVARGLATGGLTLLIGALVTGAVSYGLFNTESAESIKLAKDQTTAEEKLTAQLKDKESSTVAEVDHLKSKIKFVNDLSSVYPMLLAQYKQELADGKDGIKTKEKLETTEKALTSMLGAEAVERIRTSGDVKKAMDDEVAKLEEKQTKLAEVLRLERQAIIDHSTTTINKANERLEAIKAETQGLAVEAQKQIDIYGAIDAARVQSLQADKDKFKNLSAEKTRELTQLYKESGGEQTPQIALHEVMLDLIDKNMAIADKKLMDQLGSMSTKSLADKKQAVADAAAAGNPYKPSGTGGGTVDDSGKGGRHEETAYMKAKGAYEAEAAKREADAAMAGYKYTLAEKLALFHQYLDNVEKLEDSKHHEQTDFKKSLYTLQTGTVKEEIAKRRSALEIAIAQENISTRAAIMERIALAKLKIKGELIGDDEKATAIKELATEEKKLADLEISIAQKKRELRQQEIKEKQTLMNLDIEHAYSLGMITTPQKIAYQKQNAQEAYQSSSGDNQTLIGTTAKKNPTDYAAMIAAFKDYQNAVTHIERDAAIQRALLASADENKTLEALNKQAQAHAQYAEKSKQLSIEMYNYQNRYQLAAVNGFKSGIVSAFDGLLERTITIGQAIKNVFKSIFKSIGTSIANDLANKWSSMLGKMLGITQKNTGQIKGFFAETSQSQQQQSYGAAAVVTQMNDELSQKFAKMCGMEITTNAAKNAAKKASDEAANAAAAISIETMLAQLAIMLILSALMGGGGDKKSTASVSLGRNPESYYSVPSFDTGSWYVPTDMFAKVHQGETIMPKTFAEDFRSAVSGGGGKTSGLGSVQVRQVNNVSTIDGRGMTKALMRSSDGVAKAFKKEVRRFNTKLL